MSSQRDEDCSSPRSPLLKTAAGSRGATSATHSRNDSLGPKGRKALFARRILDDRAGLIWVRLTAEGKAAGQSRSGLDMIIAAVAGANECVVVTDKDKDFAGTSDCESNTRGALVQCRSRNRQLGRAGNDPAFSVDAQPPPWLAGELQSAGDRLTALPRLDESVRSNDAFPWPSAQVLSASTGPPLTLAGRRGPAASRVRTH